MRIQSQVPNNSLNSLPLYLKFENESSIKLARKPAIVIAQTKIAHQLMYIKIYEAFR